MAPKNETRPVPLPKKIETVFKNVLLGFIQHPESLRLNVETVGSTIYITLQAHRDDHPRLVGTRGVHIIAMQSIFRIIAAKYGIKIQLSLLEPVVGEKCELPKFVAAKKWKSDKVLETLRDLCSLMLRDEFEFQVVEDDLAYSTHIEIKASAREHPIVMGERLQSIHLIFHAIGKNQGRLIFVEEFDPNGRDAASIMA